MKVFSSLRNRFMAASDTAAKSGVSPDVSQSQSMSSQKEGTTMVSSSNFTSPSALKAVLGGILAVILTLTFTCQALADIREATIKVGKPTKDGQFTVTIKCRQRTEGTTVTATASITATDSAEAKAEKIGMQIQEAYKEGRTKCFVSTWRDNIISIGPFGTDSKLTDVTIDKDETGEPQGLVKNEVFKDQVLRSFFKPLSFVSDSRTSRGQPLTPAGGGGSVDGEFSLQGSPQGGSVYLSVPPASVVINTTGKTANQIMQQLADGLRSQGVSAQFTGSKIQFTNNPNLEIDTDNKDFGLTLSMGVFDSSSDTGVGTLPTPPQSSSLELWTDQGCQEKGQNPVYFVDEKILVFLRVKIAGSTPIKLYDIQNGSPKLLISQVILGNQVYQLRGTITPPEGRETLQLEAMGTTVACSFTVKKR